MYKIWELFSDEAKQAVLDAPWAARTSRNNWTFCRRAPLPGSKVENCCPLGLGIYTDVSPQLPPLHNSSPYIPAGGEFVMHFLTSKFPYWELSEFEFKKYRASAERFIYYWDHGHIAIEDLPRVLGLKEKS